MECSCGHNKFVCRFEYHGDACVDGNGNWMEDIYVDSCEFDGPYTCRNCGKVHEKLPEKE